MKNRKITKRNGSVVDFDDKKIYNAISKVAEETGEIFISDISHLTTQVTDKLKEVEKLTVEGVQDIVEEVLLYSEYKASAKAYILYRDRRNQERKRDLFKFRMNLKPYEYPEFEEYKEAIQHSYWLFSEFNFTSDVQDFKVNVSDVERSAIKNAMLAIAQVEVTVKTFWGDLYHRMPKPEVGSVGYTFAESEVRHHDAYAHLLELLGLNDEFEKISEIPALIERVDYLNKSAAFARTGDNRDYTLAMLLFSLFVEHVSLFSQFLIIMSFNKHKNLFKGMSNAIEATSKEEQIHGLFGIELINILREEHPEWFDEKMEKQVVDACKLAYETESNVIDWIYEAGDMDFLPKATVKEFVKNRFNNSLDSIGYERMFDVDMEKVIDTDWFDLEIIASSHGDFFDKRSTKYVKKASSITEDDLF